MPSIRITPLIFRSCFHPRTNTPRPTPDPIQSIRHCPQVDIGKGVTASGADFSKINEKGNVPALVLDDGTVLNEGAAVLAWIADQAPGKVAAEQGTSARYTQIGLLNYVASEVHPNVGGLFYPGQHEAVVAAKKAAAAEKFAYLTWLLQGKPFLGGAEASIADYYLYIVLSWTQWVGIDLAAAAEMNAYYLRVKALPNVAAAHERMATSPATTL